ncbi:putative acetyltransferase [Zhihengliuella halotolerans]|uniref:Histone acetyltransferase Rv0428c-like SH3 domain-containing protein n=1 Tax=Zhihengliuella halotolerans TaxID=370736 RepID=A0A4Q8AA68_9MICC|nr:hypothetical protein [Zhihengliuella halotolerans]RZU60997.1 hypothetical protein EV380_0552 [Zhihengliuella halotolerans]
MTIRSFDDLPAGERIVVRYRLRASGHGPTLSDALGTFTGIETDDDGAVVVIETRSGAVKVPLADITHAKQVPPAPPRRRRGP